MHGHTEKATRSVGGKFLPNTSRSYLLKAYETDKRKRDRLLAYMQRKDGSSISQIAKSLCRPTSAISEWLNCAQDGGTRARHERPDRGRKHKLSESKMSQLYADLKAGPGDSGQCLVFQEGMTACLREQAPPP